MAVPETSSPPQPATPRQPGKHSAAAKNIIARGTGALGVLYRHGWRIDTVLVALLTTAIVIVNSMSPALQGRYFFDGHHPGNMLHGALNALHGEQLLSQVQSIYGLALPYANALQLYLFGEHYLSLWVLPVIAFSAGLIIYYRLFKAFLRPLESLVAVLLIIVLNQGVLLPWSNYVVFGSAALLIWLLSRELERATPRSSTLFGLGVLIFVSALFRSQAILLYPVFLVILFIYGRENRTSPALALTLGLFLPLAAFVLKLVHDGTLRDYYVQTIAIQDALYFPNTSPLNGLRQVFEVFATGRAPDGLPNVPTGFAPFNALFGGLWFCIFLINAYVVIQFAIRWLSDGPDRTRLFAEVPPGLLSIAMLTLIGPLFALHNVWDNFRYAMHMAQGIAVGFYVVDRLAGRKHSRAVILTVTLFFAAPLYSTLNTTQHAARYLRQRLSNPPNVTYVKYFEGIALPQYLHDRLVFAQQFFEAYHKAYPDSYIYMSEGTITDAVYAIGKLRTYHKTLTNDHFVPGYPRYYPEYPTKLREAAQSRKLVFLTHGARYEGLKDYDYVKFHQIHTLSIFLPRERAANFSMP